jgi:signal transduction histidine kinase
MTAAAPPGPGAIPVIIVRRAWWWLLLGLWAMAVLGSLTLQLDQQKRHGMEVASEGLRNIFRMVVLTRSWNAGHGGVYVPVTEKTQPNPYLDRHPRRDLVTRDGQQLTLINPAFMTRQLAEMANIDEGVIFHITSLRPIRPKNVADLWESAALRSFEQGARERIEIVPADAGDQLRYMAPLTVDQTCMACHAQQGYQVGQIRGGISISLPYAPIRAAIVPVQRQAIISHTLVFVVTSLIGWLLLENLRRRWHDLEDNLAALKHAHEQLADSKRSIEQARDEAEAASQSKSAFLSTMSHELRTPMNAILGMADLLQDTELNPVQHDHLDTLSQAGSNLMRLLNDIIQYSRLDTEEANSGHVQTFSPKRLRSEVVAHLSPSARIKGLNLFAGQTDVPDIRLLGNAERIATILKRLGENAIKFTDIGEIELSVEARHTDAGRVMLRYSVRDTGIGMAPEMLTRLFKPFEIADSSTTRRHGGIGLSLATCKRLADSMGATLSVVSAPGSGSVFTLELSLEAASAANIRLDNADLARFEDLLAHDDMAAHALFAELAPGLHARMGERYDLLEQQMAAFQYVEALATLRQG